MPLLCFPQVLFAGAVVPISEMAAPAQVMSTILADRWGFESIGRVLSLDDSVVANPGTAGFQSAFAGSPAAGWILLSVITTVSLTATVLTLHRRTRTGRA